jgi:hypothetical protein
LDTIDLESNLLSNRLNATLFKYNKMLSTVILAGNRFTKLIDAIVPLIYVRSTITILALQNNQIEDVTGFFTFDKLFALSLEGNQIKALNETSLSKLTALKLLNLGSNKIELIEENTLNQLSTLEDVDLSNNFLNKVPSISRLSNLFFLNLKNQNGRLINIPNKAFFRNEGTYNAPLSLHLDSNELKLEPNSFCSGLKSDLRILSVSYSTMKSLNKCLLRQFDASSTIFIEDYANVVNVSEICNCDLKLFGLLNKIEFGKGACKSLSSLECDANAYVDACAMQTQFNCAYSTLASTTSTTKAPTTTTAQNEGSTSKAQITSVSNTTQADNVINNCSDLKFNCLFFIFILCLYINFFSLI